MVLELARFSPQALMEVIHFQFKSHCKATWKCRRGFAVVQASVEIFIQKLLSKASSICASKYTKFIHQILLHL
jgi:hypothetical protein